jgi:hypothetical protein
MLGVITGPDSEPGVVVVIVSLWRRSDHFFREKSARKLQLRRPILELSKLGLSSRTNSMLDTAKGEHPRTDLFFTAESAARHILVLCIFM